MRYNDKVISHTEKTEAIKLDSKKLQNGQFKISRNNRAEWAEGEFASKRVESSQFDTDIVRKHDQLTLDEDFTQTENIEWKELDNLKTEGRTTIYI